MLVSIVLFYPLNSITQSFFYHIKIVIELSKILMRYCFVLFCFLQTLQWLRGPDFDVTEELRTLESDEQKQNQKEEEENHNEKIVDEKKSSIIVRVLKLITLIIENNNRFILKSSTGTNRYQIGHMKSDHIKQPITLTLIT
jgi:hypothetical protein